MRFYTTFDIPIIKRCPLNKASLNIPIDKPDEFGRSCFTCRRFLQIIPTHPYKTVECTDELIKHRDLRGCWKN